MYFLVTFLSYVNRSILWSFSGLFFFFLQEARKTQNVVIKSRNPENNHG